MAYDNNVIADRNTLIRRIYHKMKRDEKGYPLSRVVNFCLDMKIPLWKKIGPFNYDRNLAADREELLERIQGRMQKDADKYPLDLVLALCKEMKVPKGEKVTADKYKEFIEENEGTMEPDVVRDGVDRLLREGGNSIRGRGGNWFS
jgi:hypothetical protein